MHDGKQCTSTIEDKNLQCKYNWHQHLHLSLTSPLHQNLYLRQCKAECIDPVDGYMYYNVWLHAQSLTMQQTLGSAFAANSNLTTSLYPRSAATYSGVHFSYATYNTWNLAEIYSIA